MMLDRQSPPPRVTRPLFAAAVLLCVAGCGDAHIATPALDDGKAVDDTDELRSFAETAIGDFGSRLQSALKDGMASGGPVAAVEVCRAEAGSIAAASGQRYDVTLRRTSLRTRNPDNAPDAWERETLEGFAEALAAGEPLAQIHALSSRREGDRVHHRYMKPIVTGAICLTCHGRTLAPELEGTLDRLYPHDRARGYEAGELRGAFSLAWTRAAQAGD